MYNLYLVKEAMGAGRNCFIAVHTPGTNDPDRQFSFLHLPYLHIAGMRA
jgi:hypothetical protein